MNVKNHVLTRLILLLLAGLLVSACQTGQVEAPEFYRGVDLSYVNEMEDCGAVYHVNGEPQDPFQLFQEQGANLVRARLWHNPDWTAYSSIPDVSKTFARASEQGMATLLDFHYSDNWADPGQQTIPKAWQLLNEEDLPQAVYDYTYDALLQLHEDGLMPDFVQVGNETNSGMLKRDLSLDWPRDSQLFNAGIRAVRAAAAQTETTPKVILHVAQPENTGWWFREATANGVTDFDVIGISYYPQWSTFSVTDMGNHVTYLRNEFGKEVVVLESAYPWTYEAVNETADNILDKHISSYPPTIAGQRQFMIDLTQSLISNGALGVVYWEPAWVSTKCETRWGQGSHWENATFFDFTNNNELHAGADFLGFEYLRPSQPIDGIIEENYGDPLLTDAENDQFGPAHNDLLSLHITEDADSLYLALTIADDIFAAQEGTYLIYLDTTEDGNGANLDVGRRPILVAAPHQPEYRLDVSIADDRGTAGGRYAFYAWQDGAWQEVTLTGAGAVQSDAVSVIEVQIPKAALNHPKFVNAAVVSAGRGRVHTAVDILGNPVSPQDLTEAVTLQTFARYDISEP